ncbi:MAG TPA: DNA translocase FtsK 4TM domain-containing protein [Planctomycetaceae bacterium]|jgi:S-DNA-T family DNA segregation ATPase FtsK/SpoIIIE|nr:DNA translocase FtsK 4TM domain-containing protein [Planctomycetaceae bacterium]
MDLRRLRTDLLALCLLAFCVVLALCLWSYDPIDPPGRIVFPPRATALNVCGPYGAQTAYYLHTVLGLGSFFLVFSLLMMDLRLFIRNGPTDHLVRLFGVALGLSGVCMLLQRFASDLSGANVVGSGGYAGALGLAVLEKYFSAEGITILIATCVAAGLLIAGELSLVWLGFAILFLPFRLVGRIFRRHPAPQEDVEAVASEEEDDEPPPEKPRKEPKKKAPAPGATTASKAAPKSKLPIKVNPPIAAKSMRDEVIERLESGNGSGAHGPFEVPSLDLLEPAEDFPYETLASKAQAAAVVLEKTFKDFNLNVHVVEIDTGPVVTQFELELEAGLRLSKVAALADDLAIALRVPSVRVVPSIPGKNTVGVEVPNEKQVLVRLRELIEACPDAIDKMRIPIFLGKDVSGRPLAVDLTKMPHLLIAGRTGTGKSVCLNTLILSMLMTRSPDQVKMLLIDPKMVELSPYKRVPHLMHPVITDMKKAEAVLAWAVDKMEERYDLLAQVGVRHLDNYNKLGKEAVLDKLGIDADSEEAERIPETMPYIVIIADEMADMMMTSGKDVEGHIIRLAQKSRAVGIHLVLATQKPTVDVITGLIKSNLPARISFQVSSRTDSRVVLDEMGADRLLGNGDMLYLAPGTSNLTRAQGTYVNDEEINNIIEFFSGYEPQYSKELTQLVVKPVDGKGQPDASRQRDDMYDQAVEVVIREGRGSVSLLQRALGIGYGRGARLIDYMAEDGIVGDYNGSQAREVLYTFEQWEELKSGRPRELVGAMSDDEDES